MPNAKYIHSAKYAAEIAWTHQHMTGDQCIVVPAGKPGRWLVLRNTGDEWVVV